MPSSDLQPATRIIHLAQYLAGLSVWQDAWREAGEALVKLVGADLFAVGAADGILADTWVFADAGLAASWTGALTVAGSGGLAAELQACISETLDSGFLLCRTFHAPLPLAVTFLPIVRENQNAAVMLVGHRRAEPLPNAMLDVYLAAAGLVATTVTRLAAECELREHRRHLAELVEQRTVDLTAANRQLEREIGERRRNEAIMAARLRLIAYAAGHTLVELLRTTLDEAEALTGSRIGFYHFMEPDQHALSLQAWSTNTIGNLCRAAPTDRHYPVDEAGVWADCIRTGQPLIHNDYASLPHRKGLPPGHAQVVRQLTVPVFRGGLIKAILGVGNKPENYTETDVGVVVALADLAWDIVESKLLQERLQRQATTDELTGVPNRRHFIDLAKRELSRAARHGQALALALMDLDHFKDINDTHGHAAGDSALVAWCRICRDTIRDIDLFARFGGDEFVLLLPDTNLGGACAVLERVRLALATQPLVQDGITVNLTISVGVAALPGTAESLNALLAEADQALYRAKEAGRNCVMPPVTAVERGIDG
jgi:diguanylate cyclase (GGDEF)-like protein